MVPVEGLGGGSRRSLSTLPFFSPTLHTVTADSALVGASTFANKTKLKRLFS